MKHSMAFNRS